LVGAALYDTVIGMGLACVERYGGQAMEDIKKLIGLWVGLRMISSESDFSRWPRPRSLGRLKY
jgi:hypothetical protein